MTCHSKIIGKSNPWITVYILGIPLYLILILIHVISFGIINGIRTVDCITRYCFDKDFEVDRINRR